MCVWVCEIIYINVLVNFLFQIKFLFSARDVVIRFVYLSFKILYKMPIIVVKIVFVNVNI